MKRMLTVKIIRRNSPLQCQPACGLVERTPDAAATDAGNAAP